jgi:hypothetical protein
LVISQGEHVKRWGAGAGSASATHLTAIRNFPIHVVTFHILPRIYNTAIQILSIMLLLFLKAVVIFHALPLLFYSLFIFLYIKELFGRAIRVIF